MPTSINSMTKPASIRDVRKTLLAAVNDSNSIFSHLRGTPHVLELIIRLATNELRWKKCIRVPNFDLDKEIVGTACGAATVELAEDEESLLFLTPLNGCEAGDHVDHDDRTTGRKIMKSMPFNSL